MSANDRLLRELTLRAPIEPGKSASARLVQEYLAVNGFNLVIDGDWGAATTRALQLFKPGATKVDQDLMNKLARPITQALAPYPSPALLAAIIWVAERHLRAHPIEIGGQNMGPWVRIYMDGNEGKAWPWCAGFVTRVIEQAAEAMGISVPEHLKRTYSCDLLGLAARKAKKLVAGTTGTVVAGSVFLVPAKAKSNDWVHTGIIIEVDGQTFTTIEGNTNDEGSREGFEVCRRIRARSSVDAVLI